MDINSLANQYVQNTINSYLPYINGAPTSFTKNNPFSNYFDPNSDASAQKNLFDQYYGAINNNYNQLSSLRNQNYGNTYNTDSNYYNQSQKNFLDYQNKLYQNNYSNAMGTLQGQGIGNSSAAQLNSNNLNNSYQNTINSNALDTQHNLDTASNAFNYNTQTNNLNRQANTFNQGQAEAKDIGSAVNQDTANAQQRYNTMQNDYYNNYNYTNYQG